jgi:dTDP-4-amino-4,6-dideoxygalactose transaminase
VWKPMHLQRLYSDCEHYGGAVSQDLYERGICLPSSSSLTAEEQAHVISHVRAAPRASASAQENAAGHLDDAVGKGSAFLV